MRSLPSVPGGPLRRLLPAGVAGLLVLAAAGAVALWLVGSANPETAAGYVGYLTRGAVFGETRFIGTQVGPTSPGRGWLLRVVNVSVTPYTYNEDFSGDSAVMAKDNLRLSFRTHLVFRVRADRVKDFVERFSTLHEGKDVVQIAYGNFLREPLRNDARDIVQQYDSKTVLEHISEINRRLTDWALGYTKDSPFEVLSVVVGNIQFPQVVADAVARKLEASQDLERKATEVEIARREADRVVAEARGKAEATQILQSKLTPLYVQHEAIEAQKALATSQNHTVIYIPVGPNGVPLVSTAPPPR
jgi:regulator of protease activity HflC (stomatin/prohibitin superfamily)